MTSFLSKTGRLDKKQLKYNTQKDIEEKNFKLTAIEEKLYSLNSQDHNTIDIINDNMKLKELLRYLQGEYFNDLAEFQNKENQVNKDL